MKLCSTTSDITADEVWILTMMILCFAFLVIHVRQSLCAIFTLEFILISHILLVLHILFVMNCPLVPTE